MSHFTEFEIRRFSFIFEQYAVDAKVKAAQSSRKTAAPQDFVLPSRLNVPGLVELLVIKTYPFHLSRFFSH